MRFKNLLFVVSLILIFEGISFLLCFLYGIHYDEPLKPFIIPALISLFSGIFLFSVSNKRFEPITNNRESIVLIIVSWLVAIVVGTLPFLISKSIPATVDAFFETISGFTTTGSSVLTNVEQLPKSILFWRSLTQWLGGLGTIIMFITVISFLNIGGYRLFKSDEESGTAYKLLIRIVAIYCTLTFVQVLLLYSGGLNLFESLCYTFGTVSTGGFSPYNNSIAGYSNYTQYVMILFMFLSGISYIIYYRIITGKSRSAIRNEEVRIYTLIILCVALFITGVLHFQSGNEFRTTLRESIFQVTSFVTTSGYSVTYYFSWPDYVLVVLFFFLLTGAGTISASGGIKISRLLILFRNFKLQFKSPNFPSNISAIKYNGSIIDKETNLSILTFITVFGLVFVLGTIALSLFGNDLKQSAFLSISALTTFGHNLDLSQFPNAGKITLNLLMLFGRMEIYPLLLVFIPSFYRKYRQ
ncbi:MAG: TrkH family potassium uptake protein [Bacteroidales bacterium]|nr:TrkH family potassium uptake protein [Bacteroidales bacterium]